MEKQRIRDQIGLLEEQFELLEEISFKNGAVSSSPGECSARQDLILTLQGLKQALHEQSLQKSVPAQDFLKRVSGILIREAAGSGLHDISVSTHGTGRISLDMVETCMGAILACVKASIKTFENLNQKQRKSKRLFSSLAFYLEATGAEDEFRFRIMDDGPGFPEDSGGRDFFQRVRIHVARNGGWFSRRKLPSYGECIEFRVPLPTARATYRIMEGGGSKVLVSAGTVIEIRRGESAGGKRDSGFSAVLDGACGLLDWDKISKPPIAVKVAVADLELWIRCDNISDPIPCRRIPAEGFLEPEAWFSSFGSFLAEGAPQLLPVLDGEYLAQFYLEQRRENAR